MAGILGETPKSTALTACDEADIVVRWLTAFAARGIVTIGGKGGAIEAARKTSRLREDRA